MASSKEPALDEIQWKAPNIAQHMQGIHTNSVLHYFSHSPFFDATSNNAILTTQAQYNPNLVYILQTREAFEGRLKTMQGLEFMVAHDPSNNGQQLVNSGVWVIRKQNRRKAQGYEDEITPLSSYFVIGENVYMAPSVANVIGSRMLSIVTSLTNLFSTASTLPIFTPSLGHTYILPTPKAPSSVTNTQSSQLSKESTPAAGTQSSAKTAQNPLASNTISASDLQDIRTLGESFSLSLRYGHEYMDENPLMGEPGSFILSKSQDAPSQSQSQPLASNLTSAAPSGPPTPRVDTSLGLATTEMKGIKALTGEKSPGSPGTKDKKARRKSKAAGVVGQVVT